MLTPVLSMGYQGPCATGSQVSLSHSLTHSLTHSVIRGQRTLYQEHIQRVLWAWRIWGVGLEFVVVQTGPWRLTLPNVPLITGYKESCSATRGAKAAWAAKASLGRDTLSLPRQTCSKRFNFIPFPKTAVCLPKYC